MHIEHNLHGGRKVVSDRNGKHIVSNGKTGGYVQRPLTTRNGHSYYARTSMDHGVAHSGVYRGYSYGGHTYYGYQPAAYYSAGFYGWAGGAWASPLAWDAGAWGWGGAPWLSFYGFTPYGFYPGPAFWLTDYLLAANLQAAYAGMGGDGINVMASQLWTDTGTALSQGHSAASTASVQPGGEELPPALDPARRNFVVASDLAVTTVSDNRECSLTAGDVIIRITDTPDADQKVNVSVTSAKKSDCHAGEMVSVSVDDLQEMRNHFQEQVDSGLKTMAAKAGTHGMPKAPDASTVANSMQAGPPDQEAAADLQEQQRAADQTESEAHQEVAAAAPQQ